MLIDQKELVSLTSNKQFCGISPSKSPSTVKLDEKRKKALKSSMLYVNCDGCDVNNSCGCPKSKTNVKFVKKTAELFDAILDNDFIETRRLIYEEQLDINAYNIEGNTPLHVAAATGYLDCLELLLACGAKINALDSCQHTPLEYAVAHANFDCALLLIENGADTTVIKDGFSHLW